MPAMEYESEYGIDVGNRFAGLSSEIDDPMELIQMAQQKEKALKTEKKQAKGAKGAQKSQEKAQPTAVKETVIEDIKKEGPKTDRPDRPDKGEQRGRGRGRGGRGRGRGRGAGGDRPPREGHGDGQQRDSHDDESNQRSFGGERRGFGERRGGYGQRRGFGGERRGFEDRQGERKSFGAQEGNVERRGFGSGSSEVTEQGDDSFGRRGGRGFGRPRGRGRGRGGRGREFDRHSGSDRSSVKASDKREGAGSYNWGSPQDEIEASEEANAFTPVDEEVKGSWADAAEQSENQEENAGEAGEDDAAAAKEDEAKEMTLDEYKKMVEKEKPHLSFNVRQANEGEKGFPKNAVTLKKLSENELESDSSLFFPKRIIEEKIKTSGRVKEVLPCDIKFAAVESRLTSGGPGGGRGNRRGRGGRGRGGARRGGRRDGEGGEERSGFGNKEPAVVDSYDEDFPNLH